jgi:hypothetical protein
VHRTFLSALLCAFATLAFAADEAAEKDAAARLDAPTNRWLIQAGVYTDHFNTSTPHENHQNLVGLEWWAPGNWLMGAAAFRNSFKQPAQYVYIGKLWRPWDNYPLLHVKLTGGLLHGYKGQYQDRVPFNTSDTHIAPLILPSIGLSGNRFTTDLVFFGQGALVTIGVLVP